MNLYRKKYKMKKFIHKLGNLLIASLLNVLIMFTPVHAQHIAGGLIHSLYLDSAGNVWVWGGASLAEVTDKRLPHLAMKNVKAVFANADRNLSFVLKPDGSLWGWGNTMDGQLGVIPRKNHSRFHEYIDIPRQVTQHVDFVTGDETVFALKPDHTLWVWGSMGIRRGDTVKKDLIKPVKKMNNVARVSSTSSHTLVLKTDGTLLAWGITNAVHWEPAIQKTMSNPSRSTSPHWANEKL